MKPECDLYKDGHCSGSRYGRPKCKPSSLEWLNESMEIIEPDEICRKSSLFGNYYLSITEKELEALKSGKVLFTIDEYGVFIGLKKGDS